MIKKFIKYIFFTFFERATCWEGDFARNEEKTVNKRITIFPQAICQESKNLGDDLMA